MKAELKPRIELENRTPLQDVIPLRTPFLVFFDPSSVCNFSCKFCPTGHKNMVKKYRIPTIIRPSSFKKVIDDLCELPDPIKVLRLYKDGEPMVNPWFTDIVKYAKQTQRFLQIDTTTNASYLSLIDVEELVTCGLDKIFISIQGMNSETYEKFCNYKVDFDMMVKVIYHLYENKGKMQIYIKTVYQNLQPGEEELFFRTFGWCSDRIFIEHTAPCWPDFEVPDVDCACGIYGNRLSAVQVCPYVFYSMSINSDSTVSACFLDWKHQMILGDLKRDKFKDIWQGELHRSIQKDMLEMKRNSLYECGKCGQLTHCAPDNIDPYAKEILRRFS